VSSDLEPTAAEFLDPSPGGRRYVLPMRPGLGDCAPSGRMRLDAIARWLQDVAYADVEDAGLADTAVWVVRRNRIQVRRFPRFAEHCSVLTFCSGLGRMWAERRTTIAREGSGDPDVESVALWVHLDPRTWRPMPFSEEEFRRYGGADSARRISARLRHPLPAADARANGIWHFRAAECDIADHVNNAAYWTPFEEELLGDGAEPTALDAEMEFRTPMQPGERRILRGEGTRWIVGEDDGVHASLVLSRG
jgi:acyl-ACP thioesterase